MGNSWPGPSFSRFVYQKGKRETAPMACGKYPAAPARLDCLKFRLSLWLWGRAGGPWRRWPRAGRSSGSGSTVAGVGGETGAGERSRVSPSPSPETPRLGLSGTGSVGEVRFQAPRHFPLSRNLWLLSPPNNAHCSYPQKAQIGHRSRWGTRRPARGIWDEDPLEKPKDRARGGREAPRLARPRCPGAAPVGVQRNGRVRRRDGLRGARGAVRGPSGRSSSRGLPTDASQAGSRSSVGMGTPVPKGLLRIHRPRAQPLPTLLLNPGLSGRPARSPGPWAPSPADSPGWGQ